MKLARNVVCMTIFALVVVVLTWLTLGGTPPAAAQLQPSDLVASAFDHIHVIDGHNMPAIEATTVLTYYLRPR